MVMLVWPRQRRPSAFSAQGSTMAAYAEAEQDRARRFRDAASSKRERVSRAPRFVKTEPRLPFAEPWRPPRVVNAFR
jgi:hypothetical protein